MSDSRDVKSHNVSSVTDGHFLPILAKDHSRMTICTSANNTFDCDQHFLFDRRWRNGVYITNEIGDDVMIKENCTMPLPEFHVNRSRNLTRFGHRKYFSPGNPKPLVFGADYIISFPSVLLATTTQSVSERICLSQNYKNRSKMKNKASHLFSTDTKDKSQSYPDPLLGATAYFVQRVAEISSLEAETVRKEKIRRLKMINRLGS